MALIGYARVSTGDQTLDPQTDALTAAGCARIFPDDRVSGALRERPGLTKALDYCRGGDILVVTKLDRAGRSLRNLLELRTHRRAAARVHAGQGGGRAAAHRGWRHSQGRGRGGRGIAGCAVPAPAGCGAGGYSCGGATSALSVATAPRSRSFWPRVTTNSPRSTAARISSSWRAASATVDLAADPDRRAPAPVGS